MRHLSIAASLLCALLAGAATPASAQGLFGRLKDKVKQAADNKSNQAMDSAVSKVANAIVCVVTDKKCMADAAAKGKPIKVTDTKGKPVSSADSAAAISAAVSAAAAAAEPALDSGSGGAGTATTESAVGGAGGKGLYDELAASGHAVTHGIVFASSSARIQPQSKPTLDEIGAMLKSHADLELLIEGHTDDMGSAVAAMSLSQQRAEAVKRYLVSTYGIAASRLTTRGFGSTKPVAPNTTPEGRQSNNRIEFVRM